jgi:hypothetical protein
MLIFRPLQASRQGHGGECLITKCLALSAIIMHLTSLLTHCGRVKVTNANSDDQSTISVSKGILLAMEE